MGNLNFNKIIKNKRCKEVNLPSKLSNDLLYFIGVLVGDGSLPIKYDKRGYRKYVIVIEKANKYFIINIIKPLVENLFKRKWSLSIVRNPKRKIKYSLYLNSKPLYIYLTNVFGLPNGKKSHKVRMPAIIRVLPPKKRLPFIAGIMDTDWGRCGENKFGSHCASYMLLKDIRNTLKSLLKKNWKIKKYVQKEKYISYQLVIPKTEKYKVLKLMQTYYPLKNQKRINELMPRAYRLKV